MSSKQIMCEKGHFYNSSYGSCPVCAGATGGGKSTVLLDIGSGGSNPPKDTSKEKGTVYLGNLGQHNEPAINSVKEDNTPKEVQPPQAKEVVLAGWLIIISESGKGESFEVTFGFNSIGRSDSNHITITNQDNSISRERHASVIYDYSNNIYFLKHEDGKYLTYLNGAVVLETKELKGFDKLKIGNTELLFVPLCGEQFKWEV